MKKITLYIIAFLISGVAVTQNATEVFENYLEHKKKENNFQVDITYALYKGKEGGKAYESYKGVQAGSNDAVYQKLGDMELVQGKDFIVKLNKEEKAMLVGYSSKPIVTQLSQIDNTKILQLFEEKTLKNEGNLWRLILTSSASELSQFSSIELLLDKSNYTLVKQIFYYSAISDFSSYDKNKKEQELNNPRLEITYKNYSHTVKINSEVFKSTHYFSYKNNKLSAASTYKGFEIIPIN
jgi:hypothetical protein